MIVKQVDVRVKKPVNHVDAVDVIDDNVCSDNDAALDVDDDGVDGNFPHAHSCAVHLIKHRAIRRGTRADGINVHHHKRVVLFVVPELVAIEFPTLDCKDAHELADKVYRENKHHGDRVAGNFREFI